MYAKCVSGELYVLSAFVYVRIAFTDAHFGFLVDSYAARLE
jgi:hypothetical protein